MKQKRTAELGIACVPVIMDCLQIVRDNHMDEYCTDKDLQEHLAWVINDLIDNFCKPLIEYDKDIEIDLEV